MRYLREVGKELAQAYPDHVAILNLDKPGAHNLYVERLFEGFAFLMGSLHEKLDDDLPELTEGLVSLLWPHCLRIIPSLPVVELSTDHRQMKQSETLSDFQVLSRPAGKRRTCRFYSATRDITLYPPALLDVSLQYEPDGRSVIRLRFECGLLVGDRSQIDLSRLPFYLNADSPMACALYRVLTLGTQQFQLYLLGRDRRTLDAHFPLLGFEDNDRLWPGGKPALSGRQLLLEYFAFREKFMFVALDELELVAWPEGVTGLEIDAVLNESWPHDLPSDGDNIRLHRMPIINLFPSEADPSHLPSLENEFLLRLMRIQDGHPVRPDVDRRRVKKLSPTLLRQNGMESQTQVCHVLAITRRQGLAGVADGLGLLDILPQRWADFWPVQVHSRISLPSRVTEKMQQALRTLDIQYQDLPQIYHCVQHLSVIETTLQQRELWYMTKLDVLVGQFRNTALRLEQLAPQGAGTTTTPPELPHREMKQPEKSEEGPQPVLAIRLAQQNDKGASPSAPSPEIPRQRT